MNDAAGVRGSTYAISQTHTFSRCRKKPLEETVSSSPKAHTNGKTGVRTVGLAHMVLLAPYVQSTVSLAHEIDPKLTAGNTTYDPSKAIHMTCYNVQKASKILGLTTYITKEQATKDIIADFEGALKVVP